MSASKTFNLKRHVVFNIIIRSEEERARFNQRDKISALRIRCPSRRIRPHMARGISGRRNPKLYIDDNKKAVMSSDTASSLMRNLEIPERHLFPHGSICRRCCRMLRIHGCSQTTQVKLSGGDQLFVVENAKALCPAEFRQCRERC